MLSLCVRGVAVIVAPIPFSLPGPIQLKPTLLEAKLLLAALSAKKTSVIRKIHYTLTFTSLIEWIVTRQREGKHRNNWFGWFNKVSKSRAWICFQTLGKYSLITPGVGEAGGSNKVDFIRGSEKKTRPSDDSRARNVFICFHPWRQIKRKLLLHVSFFLLLTLLRD